MKLNKKLSNNFIIREVVHWANNIWMSEEDRKKAIELSEKGFKENKEVRINAKKIAQELQLIRDAVNDKFPTIIQPEIALTVTSWYRNPEWEEYRNRSKKSQHTTGHGVDFIVSNVHPKDVKRVMDFIFFEYLKDWNGGLARKINNIGNYSFIHIDLGLKRRWNY